MEIKRCYDTIIGASVGENQLVQSDATSVTVQSGHKYYAKINGTESLGASTGSAITINDSEKDMVINLTQMLGSSIADYAYSLGSNGIAKLREWGFLKGYQAYNAGSIESVEVTGKKVVGFNQFNKATSVVGERLSSVGAFVSDANAWRSDYIHVLHSATYMVTGLANSCASMCCYYDADKNFISRTSAIPVSSLTLTIPNNCEYAIITQYASGSGQTYADVRDAICVNISNPDRNGEYEAYAEQEYDYGDDTLNGIFKLDASNNLYADGDVKTSDGTITRKYRIVDLGTPDWTASSTSASDIGRAVETTTAITVTGITSGSVANLVCSKYKTDKNDSVSAGTVGVCATRGGNIKIFDTAFLGKTNAEVKAMLSGVMLVCELQTPTTEQGDPFPSPQIVYPDGTEVYVTSNGVPVGHETRYEL